MFCAALLAALVFVHPHTQIAGLAGSLCPFCSEIEELRLQCLRLDAESVVARRLEDIVRGLSRIAEPTAWESRFDKQHGQASSARSLQVGVVAVRGDAGASPASSGPAWTAETPGLARPADPRWPVAFERISREHAERHGFCGVLGGCFRKSLGSGHPRVLSVGRGREERSCLRWCSHVRH